MRRLTCPAYRAGGVDGTPLVSRRGGTPRRRGAAGRAGGARDTLTLTLSRNTGRGEKNARNRPAPDCRLAEGADRGEFPRPGGDEKNRPK